jgi:hypothetical protein
LAATRLQEEKIEKTAKKIRKKSFTILDFIEVFKKLYPEEWGQLIRRYGRYGEKRRYTVSTYLSNRLELYSRKPDGILQPLTPYTKDRIKDYRRPTKDEKKYFGSPWIAVFRKK